MSTTEHKTAKEEALEDISKKSKKCINCNSYHSQELAKCPDCDTPLTQINDDLSEGTVIGEKYEIEALVGEGGMGKIYRASHKLMKRKVAIKMLHSGLVGQSATLTRFKKEAEATSLLDHTNIVTTFDFGLTPDGRPYLVMDFLDGISLSDLLKKEKVLAPDRCINLFIQLCAGLEHAHTKGIIHRDIKPSNIFIVLDEKQNEIIKILDFGIAKRLRRNKSSKDREETDMTAQGTIFGSPLYMSPEQARGDKLDFRSDIYSLSCLLYQCLTGTPPYQSDNSMDCMYLHLHESPEPFARRYPTAKIPDSVQNIVFKGLKKDPEERIESMEEYETLLRNELAKLESDPSSTGEIMKTGASENVEKQEIEKVVVEDKRKPNYDKLLSWAIPLGMIVALAIATSISDVRVFNSGEEEKEDALPVIEKVIKSEMVSRPKVEPEKPKVSKSKESTKENNLKEEEVRPNRKALQLPLGKSDKNRNRKSKQLNKLLEEGKTFYRSGDYLKAQNRFIDASRLAHRMDKNSIEYVETVSWLGKTLLARRKYRQSVIYLKWAASKLESALGKDSEETKKARAELNLALRKAKN